MNSLGSKLQLNQKWKQSGFREQYNLDLCLAFVDYNRAFGSREPQAIMKSSENSRIDSKCIFDEHFHLLYHLFHFSSTLCTERVLLGLFTDISHSLWSSKTNSTVSDMKTKSQKLWDLILISSICFTLLRIRLLIWLDSRL